MPDREFATVATDIATWQNAALQLPLPELEAMTSIWHKSLIESLNAFNASYARHQDGSEPPIEFEQSVVAVIRRATALAIFAVGAAHRERLAVHQN